MIFFYSTLIHLVSKRRRINKNLPSLQWGPPLQHHQEHVESSQRWVWSRRTFGASHLQLGSTKQDFAQKKYFRPTGTAPGTPLLCGLLSSIISAFILCMYRTQQNSNFGFLVRFSENWHPWCLVGRILNFFHIFYFLVHPVCPGAAVERYQGA